MSTILKGQVYKWGELSFFSKHYSLLIDTLKATSGTDAQIDLVMVNVLIIASKMIY